MTLQELHDRLAELPQDAELLFDNGEGVEGLCSWRGEYAKLTIDSSPFDLTYPPRCPTVGDLLAECEQALDGKAYEGYKGGDYVMRPSTAVYADPYGRYIGRVPTGFVVKDGCVVIQTFELPPEYL